MRTALAGWTAVILCGLVCGVVFFLLSAATLALFADPALSIAQGSPSSPRMRAELFFAVDLLMGVWAMWLYRVLSGWDSCRWKPCPHHW